MKTRSSGKAKLVAFICAAALVASSVDCNASQNDPGAIAVDAILVRPFCLLATVCGSAIFVVSLPVAATSRSIPGAARALIVKPAQATFTRPLGDLEYMEYMYEDE